MGCLSGIRKTLPAAKPGVEEPVPEATVIPSQDSLIGDLLSMDISSTITPAPVAQPTTNVDLLGGDLDILVSRFP